MTTFVIRNSPRHMRENVRDPKPRPGTCGKAAGAPVGAAAGAATGAAPGQPDDHQTITRRSPVLLTYRAKSTWHLFLDAPAADPIQRGRRMARIRFKEGAGWRGSDSKRAKDGAPRPEKRAQDGADPIQRGRRMARIRFKEGEGWRAPPAPRPCRTTGPRGRMSSLGVV